MLSPILTLFACISKPLWLNIRATGEQRWQADNFTLHEWRKPSLHGRKSQDQDRDRDSGVPRPRPRPRPWGSKTKTETETRGFQDQDQDSWGSKTKTETKTCKNGSRDQDSSLESSKSGNMHTVFLANVNSCSCSLYVVVRPSVCRLSVTFGHPTQPIEIFGNVSAPFNTLVTWRHPGKILRRSSQGNPSVGGLNQRVIAKCSDFGRFRSYISETVQDMR